MFRIYYSDRVQYGGDPNEAPDTGVLFVAEIRAGGRRFVHMGGEYYCFRSGIWFCSAIKREDCLSLKGQLIDTASFEQLKQEVFEWLLRVS